MLSFLMKFTSVLTAIITLNVLLHNVVAQPATIQLDIKSKVAVVLPQNATLPEQTAASELKEYLTQITGGEFSVQAESAVVKTSSAIYVGATKFATRAGIAVGSLPSEEWRIKTQNRNLVLAGGGTRGTLYATYHFLEDVAGVRWWNPYEETIPSRQVLRIAPLDSRGKPTFAYRDIYQTYGHDKGRFAIRNRLNRDGDSPIAAEYGGSNNYGPPYFVHTFFKILPPATYFKDHPEWFIGNGANAPTALNAQLALSNPAMRQEFLKLLRDVIRKSHQDAKEKNLPAPTVFSVSQEDNNVKFETAVDTELVKENDGADAAVLIDFVNFLADGIKDEFPEVYIDTLAYYSGEKAPTKIRPRDNVIIRLTDTTSNLLLPVTHPRNYVFHDNLVAWSKVAKNLRVWDYAITYRHIGLPMPTVNTYATDFRFFAAHHVEGVFIEHEHLIFSDARDLKVWLQCKLLENPNRDYDELLREFTDGFYGPAGPVVRRYLTALEEQVASMKTPPEVDWFAPSYRHRYLTLDFATRANAIFDEAAQLVADDPILSRRVRHARLPLDRAIVFFYNQWARKSGDTPETMPLDREAVTARFIQTSDEQIKMRIPEAQHALYQKVTTDEIAKSLIPLPPLLPTPEKFREVDPEKIVVYSARDMRISGDIPKVVPDELSESGITTRLEIDDANLETFKLPLPWGVYDVASKKGLIGGEVKADEIPGPGYHWYKLGTGALKETAYLYFLRTWIIQVDMNGLDAESATQQFEIWANIKFEGPATPHGQPNEKNTISIERLVLLKR